MGTAIEPDMGDLRRAWMVSGGVQNAYRQNERRSLASVQSSQFVRLPRRLQLKAELHGSAVEGALVA
jgi:hypothetical protein